MSSYSIFNSCYLNNKVTCEKFDVLLYATFGRPLDVQISPLSTRLQWTEKGRPMDVQYGTWTDGPNKDVLWTSFGRAMPIGIHATDGNKELRQSRTEKVKYVLENINSLIHVKSIQLYNRQMCSI